MSPPSLVRVSGPPQSPVGPGAVDYRLARQGVLDALRKGRVARESVCDAQRELLRAARSVGRPVPEPCPVCDEESLVHVSYVFGSKLPAFGRCITTDAELRRFAHQSTPATCYVVEVCPECRWNHLVRAVPLGRTGVKA